jgi:hypothetical protein
MTAGMLGMANELFGSVRQGRFDEAYMDEYNNACGQRLSNEANSLNDCKHLCCQSYKTGHLIRKPGPHVAPGLVRDFKKWLNSPASSFLEQLGIDLPEPFFER